MKITVNGNEVTDGFNADGSPKPLENKPRLRWIEIGMLAGIQPQCITNNMEVTYTLPPDPRPKQHRHGHILIVVDGMQITARA
jgi:hypothetical protein